MFSIRQLSLNKSVSSQNLLRAKTFGSPSFKPLVTTQKRFFQVHHYTSDENIDAIKSSDKLHPGDGNLGKGVYMTTHQPGVASNFEIATAIRNPRLPFNRFSSHVSFDTDDLEKHKIRYEKKGTTVFIPTTSPLRMKTLNATFGKTPGEEDDPSKR